MSRNFDLMAQLETELEAKTDRNLPSTDHVAAPRKAPGNSEDAFQVEMKRFIQRAFLPTNGSAPRQVVFCGVNGKSGSSFVCAEAGRNLAAISSVPICLIDANVHSPRLSAIFGVESTPTSGKAPLARERCVQVGNNLWLAGTAVLAGRNGELLPVDELKELLAQLGTEFEYLLIDVAEVNLCDDAVIFGQVTDAAILVIEADSTRRLSARKAKETLDAAKVRLLGTVLHNRSFPIPESLYKRL